jgi:hypothetical protein
LTATRAVSIQIDDENGHAACITAHEKPSCFDFGSCPAFPDFISLEYILCCCNVSTTAAVVVVGSFSTKKKWLSTSTHPFAHLQHNGNFHVSFPKMNDDHDTETKPADG